MAHKNVTSVGRRKSASARVSARPAENTEATTVTINSRGLNDYFPRAILREAVMRPVVLSERVGRYDFTVNVSGGGTNGQAGAVIHGIARALEKLEPELRDVLKKAGLLTRDPREVERKKPGKHKARKSTQFSKR